jgi:hypothetical protein
MLIRNDLLRLRYPYTFEQIYKKLDFRIVPGYLFSCLLAELVGAKRQMSVEEVLSP